MSSYTFSKYQVVTHNPRHYNNVNQVTPEEITNIESALTTLPKILGLEGWVLTGGLAIPATTGDFTRFHGDIDIGMNVVDLPQVANQILKESYGLFSRRFMGHTSPKEKIDIYEAVTPAEAVKLKRKNLRFVRLDSRKKIVRHEMLLDYIDIYLFVREGNTMICLEDGWINPIQHNIGSQYKTRKGVNIPIRNIEYLRRIKEKRNSPKDIHDLKIIDSWLKLKSE